MIELNSSTPPSVCVILVNWNGWKDTIECLESVFRLNYPHFTVAVCDNDSADNSITKISDWARGDLPAHCDAPDLRHLTSPPLSKPLPFVVLSSSNYLTEPDSANVPLALLQTGANLGFAGGNNVGIRFALRHNYDYVWLLNNDTVVDPDALSAMVRMTETNPHLGICGSLLRAYTPPHVIQTAGGRRYDRWSSRTRPLRSPSTPRTSVEPGAPDYVEGASMLIRRSYLEQAGLLDERYFLYFEELDLAARARPLFTFGYSPESIVYHKEGASIGSALRRENRSTLADFYQSRNRLIFTRRFYPWCLPTVILATLFSALQRLLIGRPHNAAAIARGIQSAVTGSGFNKSSSR